MFKDEIRTIWREIKRHETTGKTLPKDIGRKMIETLLDPVWPKEKNKKSKIEVVVGPYGVQKKDTWTPKSYANIPNTFFCDIMKFGESGSVYSYSLDESLWIRDSHLSAELFRSMRFGYFIGRFGFNGTGSRISFSVVSTLKDEEK
jgi:hypothetical protein